MKTTVDIDEALLREAEARARQQGKPLAALLEEALRNAIHASGTASQIAPVEPLGADDPFFAALDEIRALGRVSAGKPAANLQ